MTILHGFELLRDEQIEELNTHAQVWRHQKTGAELLSLLNEDENKVFGITFRTPVNNDTGVAHILEHAVLAGSRKYPLKEPFVELLKGSLNTFVNAFTFPDKTCYPVASQNVQDFYNLIDVYLDAVLYPRLAEHTFEQEGWHYELADVGEPLTYKGVVFNEMKGSYGSPDRVLGEAAQQSVFPDTIYSVDSGGHPRHIPDLTWEMLRKFHANFYHPSNSRIFFYGDDDPEQRLRILDGYLSEFERLEIDSTIPLQPPYDVPRQVQKTYAASEDGAVGNRSMIALNWLLPQTTDVEMTLAMNILGYVLTGMSASPLRIALLESGLGEDLVGGGVDDQLQQMYFSTGLKGISTEKASEVETLILDTLRGLADGGLDPKTVQAALNTVEFSLRENNTGSFPRGISLMLRSLGSWLYDDDPLAPLRFEAPMESIKQRVAAGEQVFEDLIRTYLVDNQHRTTVLLQPDAEQAARETADELARLEAARSTMNQDDLRAVMEKARVLQELQVTPDPPEALATIPTLTLDDLDRQNKTIPIEISNNTGARIVYHDLFTNGIVYLDLGLDLHTLSQDMLPYVSLFGRALLEMGAADQDYIALSQRIGRTTGGIHPQTLITTVRGTDQATAWLFLRGKAMPSQIDDLLSILHDVLNSVRLDNPERFRQIVLEEKAGQEARLAPAGHQVVNTRLRSRFNEAGVANEAMGGIDYLFFLRSLAQEIESDWSSVVQRLEDIRRTLLNRSAMLVNVTVDQENWANLQTQLHAFLTDLPETSVEQHQWSPHAGERYEAFTFPSQVNYVGKGAHLYKLGYELHGSQTVISSYLNTTWLWERVRVRGGAYGGFSVFDPRSGVFTFVSYRDPNLLPTLEIYDGTSGFLKDIELDDAELTRAIIGAIGGIDSYQLPDAKGWTSLTRYLAGDTDEDRQRLREEVLGTTVADFRAFGEVLARASEVGLVTVLGSSTAIEAANAEGDGVFEVTPVM